MGKKGLLFYFLYKKNCTHISVLKNSLGDCTRLQSLLFKKKKNRYSFLLSWEMILMESIAFKSMNCLLVFVINNIFFKRIIKFLDIPSRTSYILLVSDVTRNICLRINCIY